jgi:ribosomal protein S18 acetylase RimI-like enzyme
METETIEGIDYHFAPPEELAKEDMARIIALVEAGGSVDPGRVRENLSHAFLIGYVRDDNGEIAACSSLKHPRAEFTQMVREQTGLDLSDFLERGYTSVLPQFRGRKIASNLLAGLTARVGNRKLYSVIGEDNIGGQKIAINNNTRKMAVYKSPKTGKKMGIWIPEWMI